MPDDPVSANQSQKRFSATDIETPVDVEPPHVISVDASQGSGRPVSSADLVIEWLDKLVDQEVYVVDAGATRPSMSIRLGPSRRKAFLGGLSGVLVEMGFATDAITPDSGQPSD